MASPTRSSNHRASLAVVAGLVGTLALPAALVVWHQTAGVRLLDAVWAIPVAAACGVAALLFARGARGRVRVAVARAAGAHRVRAAVVLGVAAICIALSGSIAVGFYELLLRLER
jgi:hypothetical protein